MSHSHSLSLFILAVLSSSTLVSVSAREFKVGGELGWLEPPASNATLYNQWAEAHRFHIGDTLVFEYEANETVVMVEKWSYYHCDTKSQEVALLSGGNSTVRLDRPGPFYFVSASVDQCKRGLRMIVHVITPRAPPSDAPSPSLASGAAPASMALANPALLLALVPLCLSTI